LIWCGTAVSELPPALRGGIRALDPCEDGTILVATNDNGIQTAPYTVDLARASTRVGQATRLAGEARYVQKIAMPGWRLYDSVSQTLTA
ncbi:MAG TPA: hypothetical protein VFQ96_07900, partial [Microbacteriaceae bacterium]|nr:hypothetical protein [Microbacteriaceae bacterium]